MDVAYLSATAALAGSVVGGLTSGITALLTQRSQVREAQLARDVSRREDLYRDFIVAASRAYGDALLSSEPQMPDLVALYGMVSRMRILCSPEVVALADKIMEFTLDTYFQPNKTIRELRDMVRANSGNWIDPLKEFSELAREELRSLGRDHRGWGLPRLRST